MAEKLGAVDKTQTSHWCLDGLLQYLDWLAEHPLPLTLVELQTSRSQEHAECADHKICSYVVDKGRGLSSPVFSLL